MHIDDRFIIDGLLDTAAMNPIASCGYDQYAAVESLFSMPRPGAWSRKVGTCFRKRSCASKMSGLAACRAEV